MLNKIIYITSLNLYSKRAQALQVKRFVKSLFFVCQNENIEFLAYSLSSVPLGFEEYFCSARKKVSRSRLLNNILMIIFLLKKKNLRKKDYIYSRDLFILLILTIFGFRTIYEYHHPGPKLNSFLLRLFNVLPTSRLITISHALKKDILKKQKFYTKEILVLPSAVEIDKYEKIPNKVTCRKDLGFNNDNYYILHTGSPYIGRGVERFIDLCNLSNEIFFVQIGGNEEDIKRLRLLAKNNNIKNCIFLTTINENKILKYQKAADLLFFNITNKWPTFWCCSPLKLPEYMASGTPILASDIGSIKELIDEKTSFLFENNIESLKRSFLRAKTHPELSKRIALAASNKVKNNFTWEIRSLSLIKFLNRVY